MAGAMQSWRRFSAKGNQPIPLSWVDPVPDKMHNIRCLDKQEARATFGRSDYQIDLRMTFARGRCHHDSHLLTIYRLWNSGMTSAEV